MGLDENRTF